MIAFIGSVDPQAYDLIRVSLANAVCTFIVLLGRIHH
jgi:hypothetical protein